MMQYFHRTVAVVGVILLLLLVILEGHGLLSRRSNRVEQLETADRLKLQADENYLPDLVRDPSAYSGRVFSAWEDLPLAESFNASDFYPRAD